MEAPAMLQYNEARRRIERGVGVRLDSLECIVGKHAIAMIDYQCGRFRDGEFLSRLEEINRKWVNVLMGPKYDNEKDEQFQNLVAAMVQQFTNGAMHVESLQKSLVSVDIYKYLTRYTSNYDTTRRHFEQYIYHLGRMMREPTTSAGWIIQANACIWSAIKLGAHLDMVL
jgi:hypothetical protein